MDLDGPGLEKALHGLTRDASQVGNQFLFPVTSTVSKYLRFPPQPEHFLSQAFSVSLA